MAPEQLRGETVDARTDLFSFGVLTYELLAGRRPFCGASAADVTTSILRDSPAPLPEACRQQAPGLAEVIARCLEKPPARRFQTARELVEALECLRRGRGTVALVSANAEIPSIAVLPFLNMSGDGENEYFADGLAEELINMLARVRNLRVSSRTSAFSFRGKEIDLATVAARLNVSTILEGSVRKAGHRVRISAQLIRVASDSLLWSESYDRELDDIFAVQNDIAHAVVKALTATLLSGTSPAQLSEFVRAEMGSSARTRGHNAEAYRLYLKGKFFLQRQTPSDLSRAADCLREALVLDSEHALAWAGMARVHALEAVLEVAPVEESFLAARTAAARALTLDPDLPEACEAMALILMSHDWNWEEADRLLRRAMSHAPGNAEVVRRAAILARNSGRNAEATALALRASAADPLNPQALNTLGACHLVGGRLTEAKEVLRRSLELAPASRGPHFLVGQAELMLGRNAEALAEMEAEPFPPYRLGGRAMVLDAMGRRAEADAALECLAESHGGTMGTLLAAAYAVRGDADSAFAWLERAVTDRDVAIDGVRTDPFLRRLAPDPRWPLFLERVGLNEA
jgi:TolB-like protein